MSTENISSANELDSPLQPAEDEAEADAMNTEHSPSDASVQSGPPATVQQSLDAVKDIDDIKGACVCVLS